MSFGCYGAAGDPFFFCVCVEGEGLRCLVNWLSWFVIVSS